MRSIRWRLPLSYAAIALVAVVSLGIILLTILRDYYEKQELAHLHETAATVSSVISDMQLRNFSEAQIEAQVTNLAFLSQTRIQLYDSEGKLRVDSGSPQHQQIVSLAPPTEQMTITYESAVPAIPWNMPVSVISVYPAAEAKDVVMRPSGGDTFFLSSTPFGFRFNQEIVPEKRSRQQVTTTFFDGENQPGYIRLSEGPAFGTKIVESVQQALIGAGAIAVVLAILAGFFVSHQISTPVLTLASVTGRMADGELSARVRMNRKDEFGLLATSFNEMAARVENTITTLRSFVADAAHELHTPITALHTNLELALSEKNEQQRSQFIHQSLVQLKRLETLTGDLLDLSRIESGMGKDERKQVDLVALLRETSELYASRAEQAGVNFQFDVSDAPVVTTANEIQIRRVVSNLLDNAIKFTPENGTVTVGLYHEGGTIRVMIQDTGIGIPSEDLPCLFSRFHRGRNAAAYPGSGLGLAITRAIVERHQGSVSVQSSSQGTAFLLQLPVQECL